MAQLENTSAILIVLIYPLTLPESPAVLGYFLAIHADSPIASRSSDLLCNYTSLTRTLPQLFPNYPYIDSEVREDSYPAIGLNVGRSP